jgi:hypothetical protein
MALGELRLIRVLKDTEAGQDREKKRIYANTLEEETTTRSEKNA